MKIVIATVSVLASLMFATITWASDEAEIYKLVLRERVKPNPQVPVALPDETIRIPALGNLQAAFPHAKSRTLDALAGRNLKPERLPKDLKAPAGIVVVRAAGLASAERLNTWPDFARTNNVTPHFVVSVSGIGFDDERSQALVYVDLLTELGGGSTVYFLERRAGTWHIESGHGYAEY